MIEWKPPSRTTASDWLIIGKASNKKVTVYTDQGESRVTHSQLDKMLRSDVHVVTLEPLSSVLRTLNVHGASCRTWGKENSIVSVKIGGAWVSSIESRLPSTYDPIEVAESYGVFWDFIEGRYGFGPCSVSYLSQKIARTVCAGMRWYRADLGIYMEMETRTGGRIGCLHDYPFSVREVDDWDMKAAYPSAMVEHPLPATLNVTSVGKKIPFPDDAQGWVYARVAIPFEDSIWHHYPLPLFDHDTLSVSYGWGVWEQWFSTVELWTALQYGTVKLLGTDMAIVGELDRDLTPWWKEVEELRSLKGMAGQFGKAVSNSLWGGLSIVGQVAGSGTVGRNGKAELNQATERTTHDTAHIGGLVAARVRARLYSEVLLHGDERHIFHVDTDGVIMDRQWWDPPEGWVKKNSINEVQFMGGPRMYRFQCDNPKCECHYQWHHVMAGIDRELQADVARFMLAGGRLEWGDEIRHIEPKEMTLK